MKVALLFVTIILYFAWGMWFGIIGALIGLIIVGLTSNGSWLRNNFSRGNPQDLQENTGGRLDWETNSGTGVTVTLNDLRITGNSIGRPYIAPDCRNLPAGSGTGGEETYQKSPVQQGCRGENTKQEQGIDIAAQNSMAVVAILHDMDQLKGFISSRVLESVDEARIEQLAIWVVGKLENNDKIILPPKVDQQVNELLQLYRQEYLEHNKYITTVVAGIVQDRGTTEQVNKKDEISNTLLAVSELPRNPHSKLLFDTYAKEMLDNSGQGWTVESNKVITENMLKNGVRPQRVEEALKQSPVPVENAYYFVKDIKNNPEIQVVQQERGTARVLK